MIFIYDFEIFIFLYKTKINENLLKILKGNYGKIGTVLTIIIKKWGKSYKKQTKLIAKSQMCCDRLLISLFWLILFNYLNYLSRF